MPAFSQQDVPGSKDHPIISRYPGSFIYHYEQKEFDEFEILLGPIKGSSDRDMQLAKKEKLEGKITKIQYQCPQNRSPLEVFKNYEEALKKAGFEVIYSARGREIAVLRRFLYPYFWNVYATADDEKNFFYLSARNKSKNIVLALGILPSFDGPKVFLGIVEKKEIERGIIRAEDIYKTIKSEGKVAIYGIYFDFNKAEIKPESKPTIAEVYKLPHKSTKDYEESLRLLKEVGHNIVPHVIIGLYYGQIRGEYNAIDMIAQFDPSALVMVVVMPYYGKARFQLLPPPKPEDSARVILHARKSLPKRPVVIGCARPAGPERIRFDLYSLYAGVNGITFPAEGIFTHAKSLGLNPIISPNCCSTVFLH